MKRLLPAIFILFAMSYGASAQVVQWASRVLAFSSELTQAQYSAQQALGKPNVMPAGGDNPNAWMPDKPNRKDFLKLGFDKPMSIKQIAVAESYGPSALYRILVYDEAGKEYELSTFNPMAIPMKGRMMNFFIEPTPYKVAAVKLEFDGAAVPDYYAIDAVAISDSNYPIVAFIPTPELLASGIVTEVLDENVNSEVNELNPILSPDGKTLYFSRSNHPDNKGGSKDKEDIWYSELGPDGKWQLAQNMSQFNNDYPNFISSVNAITPDGKSVVMVLGNKYVSDGKKTKMLSGVSISSNTGSGWTKPVALNIKNDYNFHDKANYFLANNRKTLIMSVQRDDSRGDRDLYVSFMQDDSVWTEPLSLGGVVNTAGEESSPFLALDDKTLYFASNGFSGYGGIDIYVSKRLDDTWTNWSEPENLGPDINSPLNEYFFNIPSNSEYAYYSRETSPNNTDIFRVKLPIMRNPDRWATIKGDLVDSKTGQPVGAKIIYERLPDGTDVGISQSDPNKGNYEIKLPIGHLYGIRAEAKDYISESQNIDLRNIAQDTVINFNFTLNPISITPIESGVSITLNNIFFDFDQATLKPESFSELNRLVKLMGERASMTVSIEGHADATGPEEYNLDLSRRRAAAVQKYIIGKGIDQSRVSIAYFGESKPIVSNATKEGRRKNRRVEFKIVKP